MKISCMCNRCKEEEIYINLSRVHKFKFCRKSICLNKSLLCSIIADDSFLLTSDTK